MQKNKLLKKRQIAEINIVPYVDVMLVLLIIFMVTAPVMTHGVKVELPQAAAKPIPPDDKLPVIVSVDKDANLFLNIAENPSKPIDPRILQAEVVAAIESNPKRQVLLRADKTVRYNTVMEAMVLLQRSGVAAVGLETQDT